MVHSREVLRTYDRKDVTNVNDEAAGPKGLHVSSKRPIGLLTPQAVASADSEQTLAGAHRLERGATR